MVPLFFSVVLMTNEESDLELLLEAIHREHGYDFRDYARTSLKRRLALAKERFACSSLSALQHKVLHDASFLPQLLSFLTVQVSELFRDPSYFAALREKAIPHLKTYPSLKVWVAGCSSGEELYSLAILFHEEGLGEQTIFYATDINTEALVKAERGVFDLDRAAQFAENYRRAGGKSSLSDHYTASCGAARFAENLRKHVVFADHSLVSDAVFAEVHLISCRNVLIYFNRRLQDRALGLFKDALIRRGFLGLGAKETLHFSSHATKFEEFVPEQQIYRKKGDL